jgi:hypothetical protein
VTVVSLAALVVVSDIPLSREAVEETVLEVMDARRNGLGEFPDNDLDNGSVVSYFLGFGEQRGLHILHDSNT